MKLSENQKTKICLHEKLCFLDNVSCKYHIYSKKHCVGNTVFKCKNCLFFDFLRYIYIYLQGAPKNETWKTTWVLLADILERNKGSTN